MQDVLQWLGGLPPSLLYAVLAVAAAVENIFPPFPADTVVAFGSFIAARGRASAMGSFLSTWAGNLVGATLMYAAGRKLGADWVARRFGGSDPEAAEERFRDLYGTHGIGAIFLSRFIPGVRAIVPPLAGALRVPFVPAIAAMGVASGIWYAIITWLAFRVGRSFDAFQAQIRAVGLWAAVGAAVVVLALVVLVWRRRRSRR